MSISAIQALPDNRQKIIFVSKRQETQVDYSATGIPESFKNIFMRPDLKHEIIHITGYFKSNPATMTVTHFISQNGALFPVTHENYSKIMFNSKLDPKSIFLENREYYTPSSWDKDEMRRVLNEARQEKQVTFLLKPKFLKVVYSVVKRLHIREETSEQTVFAPSWIIEEVLRNFPKDKKEEKQKPSSEDKHSPLLDSTTALTIRN